MFETKDIELFAKLTEEQLIELQSHINIHKYVKENVVFYEGDESDYLYILLEGSVKLYKTTPKNTHIYLHDFVAPNIIAIFPTIDNIPFPATCEFVTDGYVGVLARKKFDEYLSDSKFSMAIVRSLIGRMALLENLLQKELIYSCEAKVAELILNNSRIFELLKNSEIAKMLNTTSETLSRILSRFKKNQVITIEKHVVMIINKKALTNIIDAYSIKLVNN